jgi:hypothetical protein
MPRWQLPRTFETMLLTIHRFDCRNFHEVRACDIPKGEQEIPVRYTVSSFIGYLPGQGSEPATLVLWS